MSKDNVIKSWFPDLTPDDVRQLCYIAYFGEDYGSAIPQYMKQFHKSKNTYEMTVMKLQKAGYLQSRNSVTPKHHLDIMDFLAIEHMDWVDTFKKMRSYSPTHTCMYLWKLAGMLRNDENNMFTWLFEEVMPQFPAYNTADILCVSDFGWMPISEEVKEIIEEQKKKGMKFYGLNVNSDGNIFQEFDDFYEEDSSPMSVCDSIWVYENGECKEVK